MNKYKIAKNIIEWLIILLMFIISGLEFYMIWYVKNGNDLEIRPYTGVVLPSELRMIYYYDIGFNDMKLIVENEYNTVYHYSTNENEIPDDYDGSANWFIRTIYMRPHDYYSNVYHYGLILAHELTHVKYVTADEQWTTYKAITILLESESKVLREVGKYYALSILTMQYSDEYYQEYDVGAYIVEYLNSKGE